MHGKERAVAMADLTLIVQFMVNSFKSLWTAIGTWGVIGLGIIAPFVLKKIASLLKQVLRF